MTPHDPIAPIDPVLKSLPHRLAALPQGLDRIIATT